MPKQVDHDQQRNRILVAAIDVFATQGVEHTGLTHVARAVGLSRSALYTYYLDKAALLEDLANFLLERELTLFQEALDAQGSALERLEGLSRRVALLIQQSGAGGAVLLQLWVIHPEHLKGCLDSLMDRLTPVVADGQREGSMHQTLPPALLAKGLIALWDGLLLQACLSRIALSEDDMWALVQSLTGRS